MSAHGDGPRDARTDRDPLLERGIQNPNIIDLLRPSADDVVELIALQREPWPEDVAVQREQLESKLNGYFGYALEGHLLQEYPQYAGRRIRIVVEWVDEPPSGVRDVLDRAARICDERGLGIEDREQPVDGRQAPWEQVQD